MDQANEAQALERMVILLPTTLLDRLDKVAEERCAKLEVEDERALANLCARNGWSRREFVMGQIVTSFVQHPLEVWEREADR